MTFGTSIAAGTAYVAKRQIVQHVSALGAVLSSVGVSRIPGPGGPSSLASVGGIALSPDGGVLVTGPRHARVIKFGGVPPALAAR